MSRSPTLFDNIRNVLVIVLVFFVAMLFSGFILGPIITLLFFLFQYYYRKSKDLEKRLARHDQRQDRAEVARPSASSVPPPPSTDA